MMPTLSRPRFIDQLQRRILDGNLPGREAHLRMAHAVRKADVDVEANGKRDAAVLITLFEPQPEDWQMILIRRPGAHGRDKHAGQIGFPGGKRDHDDPDLMFTALREAHEEVGLPLTTVDVLGELSPLYITVSKFLVHPYVAYLREKPELIRQEEEIEEILLLPLHDFRNHHNLRETRIRLHSGIVLNHVPAFHVGGHVIWGATAMILNELLDLLPGAEGAPTFP